MIRTITGLEIWTSCSLVPNALVRKIFMYIIMINYVLFTVWNLYKIFLFYFYRSSNYVQWLYQCVKYQLLRKWPQQILYQMLSTSQLNQRYYSKHWIQVLFIDSEKNIYFCFLSKSVHFWFQTKAWFPFGKIFLRFFR